MTASTATKPSPLVRRLLRETTVDAETAFQFLGIKRDLGFRLLRAYRVRTTKLVNAGKPIDMAAVRPKRDPKTGAWSEIPNQLIGGRVRCRSDLLLWMTFPEGVGR